MSAREAIKVSFVPLKEGGTAPLNKMNVAAALLETPEDIERRYDVLVQIGGKTVPVITLVRRALKGKDPLNTNTAEMALRWLGFKDIYARRRFDKETGQPLRFTREQIKATTI
ncbi:hypothetical protein [Streptomyces amritsarensis]|uniref:hypothetical protein n=1 Tax=Streptomyces amritsarensis TaxID=681158 RepID=UPI00369066A2